MSLSGARRPARSGQAKSLIVFLHGYGADGDDLIGLADPLAPYLPDTVFVSPNAPEKCVGNPFGYQWFPIPWLDGSSEEAMRNGMANSVTLLNAYLDELAQQEGVGPENTVLLGFSQGCMMSLHVAPRREKAFAGVVGISGKLLDGEALKTETRVKPPILLMHGDQDPVVPFASMNEAEKGLKAAGFDVDSYVMHGMQHGIAPDGLGRALQSIHNWFGLG